MSTAADPTRHMPVSLRYTYEFVRRSLAPGTSRILEIGCGDGALAALLAGDGFAIVAVDSDPACIEQALARGLNARRLEWPAALGETFDAILFTRSLHHVHDLRGGVAAAAGALAERGRIIVEDFRAEGGTERSLRWYRDRSRRLAAAGTIPDWDEHADQRHDGHLHSSTSIRDALGSSLDVEQCGAAYYFRYLEPRLPSVEAAERLLAEELAAIESGIIDPLGQRFVARRRAP